MSDVVIHAERLGKRYRLGAAARGPFAYGSLRETLAGTARGLWRTLARRPRREGDGARWLWALKDVSFEVRRGEVLGVIGRNGAGKSTLLKILSRITEPTEGWVDLDGRVGSLLEVGTGFHPELSGRENIFLNGAILGMKRREIKARFDEIVEFAELAKFIDTPVKYYSSGMYMRLAFSVAAHLEPEILLVDEVLAVGDAAFQKKCLGKMGEVARGGRTVLFVSHNEFAVRKLCGQCLLLSAGRLVGAGDTDDVMAEYQGTHCASAAVSVLPRDPSASIQFTSVRVTGTRGLGADSFSAADALTVAFEFLVSDAIPDVYFGAIIQNSDGVAVLFADSRDCPGTFPRRFAQGYHTATLSIPPVLAAGMYRLSPGIASVSDRRSLDQREGACSFHLVETTSERQDPRPGILNLRLPWSLQSEGTPQTV